MKNKKVAGVVVLYNPDSNVRSNIASYIEQIDKLIIINNSTDMPSELVSDFSGNEKTVLINNKKNLGIAAALNIGARTAMEMGCEYMLTMDQDSSAPKEMTSALLMEITKSKSIGLVSPFHYNMNSSIRPGGDHVERKLSVMTSGNLVLLEAYKNIGGFNEEYFIDYVDIEFCMRLNMAGYEVLQLNDICLRHNEADIKEVNFLRTFYLYNHSTIRYYYKARNRLFLKKNYENKFPLFFKEESRHFHKLLLKILLEKQSLYKYRMILKGCFDYLRNKKGHIS